MANIASLVDTFTAQLAALLESQTLERARQAVESALGGSHAGRPSKPSGLLHASKPRRKLPRQLCPVPGCKNPAAPIFGMVCAEHKNVPRAKIKKYREARRAAKLGRKAPRPARKRAKATKKRPAARKIPKAGKKAATKAAAKKPARRQKRRAPKAAAAPKTAPAVAAAATPPPAVA